MSAPATFHGTLVAHSFTRDRLRDIFGGRLGDREAIGVRRRLLAWRKGAARLLGPVASTRTLLDRGALPLVTALGYRLAAPAIPLLPGAMAARLDAGDGSPVGLVVVSWEADLGRFWRRAVDVGVGLETGWCLCFNGRYLRVVDTRRTYARRFLEFDIDAALTDDRAFAVMWGLLRAAALAGATPLLSEIAEASDRHQGGVSRDLQAGVRSALVSLLEPPIRRASAARAAAPFEQCLTLVYRLLFLLFAEARLLVPVWHPTYRNAYSLETLCESLPRTATLRGIGESVQAVTRLASQGCTAGDLLVTAFNGPLLDSSRTNAVDSMLEDDDAIGQALQSISTRVRPDGTGRERIAYGDLGVEQLGGIYEQVIDCIPRVAPGPSGAAVVHLAPSGIRRKTTGTFYTPRSITEYLVRRTLHPLVADAAPEEILRIKVLDPAMGSGAFLVAACRYLAAAYEEALQRTTGQTAEDVDADGRAVFRRLIAQRCLYGVDINPMAVELAKLSLWLTTLSGRHPLTFLDHHLRTGDSLIGASPDDLARQPPGGGRSRTPSLPLFESGAIQEMMRSVVPRFTRLSTEPADTAAAVREKSRVLAAVGAAGSQLSRWRAVSDLWCASWLWSGPGEPPDRRVFHALTDALLRNESALPRAQTDAWLDQAAAVAAGHRAFHWSLEFPDAFFDDAGATLPNPGFDAVLSNPPWDMVRADAGGAADRRHARDHTRRFVRFVKESGIYAPRRYGHVNRYQLFIERILRLTRRGGRLGLVTPSGLATDQSAAHHRRLLLTRCETDAVVGFDNRHAIFPVHRGVRFLLVTATAGGQTMELPCRFAEQEPAVLDALPDRGASGFPVIIRTAFLERMSGAGLVIPELRTPLDVAIAGKLYELHPPLGASQGWHALFGRELNATDDRHLLHTGVSGLPVIEGKHLAPFIVDLSSVSHRVKPSALSRQSRASTERPRLACRDIASAQNRLTIIAAVLPAGLITTHTVLCLKTPIDEEAQHALCGILNSFVANYLMRLQVGSHVTAGGLSRLPVPRWDPASASFQEAAVLSRRLSDRPAGVAESTRLQALVAGLYEVTSDEFAHILATFPLVPSQERRQALRALDRLGTR